MTEVILIQGDSLPLPRGPVQYEDSWPGLLRSRVEHTHVVNRSQSEKTTDDMTVDHPIFTGRELELYSPETVIIQIGIVDCAPRYLSRGQKEFVMAIPIDIVSRAANHVLTRFRTRSRRRAYVPIERYRDNLRDYLLRANDIGVENVVIVKILTAGEKYTDKNPGVGDAIREYNAVIDEIAAEFEFVTALRPLADSEEQELEIVDDLTIEDGYHFTDDGHRRLFDRMRAVL